ncbi:hypothetical protein AB9N12_04520 [Bacteroides sp. AN502(2024)]|uniref:hypothetical protein n=1 Tax=Bacteroides sp. AN502(2024) TaxID=3160599 RepID=UPI00351154D3
MNFEIIKKISVCEFSTSSANQSYLVHYKNRFFEVSRVMALLIEVIKRSNTQEEAVHSFIQSTDGKYTEKSVIEIINKFINKLEGTPSNKKTFLLNKELIPSHVISKCTPFFSVLFEKKIMVSVLCILLGMEGYFMATSLSVLNMPAIDLYTICGLFLFFILSSLFHELGHASACQFYNIQHGGIGFGLYLNFPVFYTDVSNTWTLSRPKRCIINVAGVYFQILLLIPLLTIYFYTQNNILKYIIIMTNINFIITLNPFFKFDGYWLMTDLLGVANLRKKCGEYIIYLLKKLKRKDTNPKPYLFSLRKREKTVMIIYTCLVNLFFGYYFLYVLPTFLIKFCKSFPEAFGSFITELANHQVPDFYNLQKMATQIFFLMLTIYLLYRSFSPLFRKRRK